MQAQIKQLQDELMPTNDRELAKLSVENDMLKKQLEDLQAQVN